MILIRDIIDWVQRHILVIILLAVGAWFIGFEKETLRTIITCVLIGCACVIFSGITTYAYTKLNLIQEGNTDALSRIYMGNCLLFGLVCAGFYFAQFRF